MRGGVVARVAVLVIAVEVLDEAGAGRSWQHQVVALPHHLLLQQDVRADDQPERRARVVLRLGVPSGMLESLECLLGRRVSARALQLLSAVCASACRLRGGMLLPAGAADAVQSMLLSGLLLAVGTGSLAVRRHVPCVVCMCSGVELHEAHVVVCHGVGGKRSLRSFFRVERNLLRPGMVYRLGPACWRAAIALQQRCGMRRAQNQTLAFFLQYVPQCDTVQCTGRREV